MFNLSGSEIIVILLLALVVLGPEKLPDAIRRAGRTYAELKKMGNSFQAEMKSVLDEPMKEMRETADLLKKSMDFTDGELTGKPTTPRLATTHGDADSTAAASRRPTAAAVDRRRRASPTDDAGRGRRTGSDPDVDRRRACRRADRRRSRPAELSPEDELINRTLSGEA